MFTNGQRDGAEPIFLLEIPTDLSESSASAVCPTGFAEPSPRREDTVGEGKSHVSRLLQILC